MNEGAPYSYQFSNALSSMVQPGVIHASDNQLSAMIQRYLLQRAISVFTFRGLPDIWRRNLNYILFSLYCRGYFAVINTTEYGPIPQLCTLGGVGLFLQPTQAVIANPALKPRTMSLTIGKECEVVRLQPDYGDITDLIRYYGGLMAMCMEAAGVNLFNSKAPWIFFCNDSHAAATMQTMYDQIAAGKPAVFTGKLVDRNGNPMWTTFTRDIRNQYITTDLLENMRTIERMFDTAIGIPNVDEKKERLVTGEVTANTARVRSNCSLWLEELQAAFERVNQMFNLSISVDWRDDLKPREVENNAE